MREEELVETQEMLREDDLARQDVKICWANRHKGTAPAETGNGFVMLVAILCGNGIRGRRRTEWKR